jgi:predicted nucleic acid-binding protein
VSYGQPSFIDLSALALAKHMNALLLTNDGALRVAAANEGVDVHGTLWVLDEMLRCHVITPPVAIEALKQMLQNRSRLPRNDCEKRLS